MKDIKIGSNPNVSIQVRETKKPANQGEKFDNLLSEAISKINEVQRNAELAVKELAQGGDITKAMIDLEKADMSFQMMVEIRNRLLSAYEEIMRMQV